MKLISSTLAAFWLIIATALPTLAETLVVGLDISSSNPLVRDDAFAREVSAQAKSRIETMQPGDRVVIETFGLHGIAMGQKIEFSISRRHNPEKVAHFTSQIIAAVPRMVREGKLAPHPATNILSFLELRTEREGCGDTAFLIATDGFESSDAVSGANALPAPVSAYLTGCAVTLIGVGGGTQETVAARHLKDLWTAYLSDAGANPIIVNRG